MIPDTLIPHTTQPMINHLQIREIRISGTHPSNVAETMNTARFWPTWLRETSSVAYYIGCPQMAMLWKTQ